MLNQLKKLPKFGLDFFRGRNFYGQVAALGTVVLLGLIHREELRYRVETSASQYSARRWLNRGESIQQPQQQ